MKKEILQGEIWTIRLNPTEGSKINKKLQTITIIPFSSGKTDKSILLINVNKSKQNGLKSTSHLQIPQIRTVSKQRFLKKLGTLEKNYAPKIKNSFRLYFWE